MCEVTPHRLYRGSLTLRWNNKKNFIIFEGLWLKQIKKLFLEGDIRLYLLNKNDTQLTFKMELPKVEKPNAMLRFIKK